MRVQIAHSPRRFFAGASLLFVAALLATASGCAERAFAEQRLAARTDSFKRTSDYLAAREADAPRRFAETWRMLDRENRRHMLALQRDLRELDRYLREDFDRFMGRQTEYRRFGERLLLGKPETIERNAVQLLY